VASAAAAAEPPPLPAPSASVGHLPLPLDRFFGRRSELVRLIALLRPLTAGAAADAERLEEDVPPRLITLTGPGGSGKTRLALEVARRLQPRSRAPIWFVPLQGLTPSTSPNSDGVPTRLPILEEVRDALHLPRTPGADPLEQLVATLREQPALVILDNFEHLVEGGAPLVHLLLQRIPTLTILVASRRRLNLPGEQELAVLPLPVPMVAVNADEGAATVLTTDHSPLTTVPSVQLFVDRAQTARAGFQLTPGNAPDVAQLCARLEGIPLAIELAAGRVGALTAAQILERLSDRFALLVSRGNGGEERHRSLRATLDWSYQLLSPALQQFFRRLSIFRGGWTLEAATEVCDAAEALDHLEQLRECSLIVVDDAEGQIRFRLLETLREFGEEQLTPAEQATLAERHAAFFKTLAERAEPRMHSPERYPCLARLGPELDNFRAALSWCLDTGVQGPPLERSTVGLELASALADFWKYSGHTGEGRDWLSRLLAAADGLGRTVLRAKAMESVARLVAAQYDDAITLEEESVALWREVGDRIGLARSLSALGLGKVYSGDLARARTLLEECLALLHESDDRWLLTTALDNRGRLEQFEGNLAQARTTLEEARSLNPGIGAEEILSSTLYRLGAVAEAEGRLDEARDLYERSMAVTSMLPATDHSCALRELGHVARLRGDYAEARVRLEECLALRQRLGHATDYLASAVCQLVEVMLIQGDHATATSLAEQWLARLDPAEHPYRTAQTLRLLARAAYETGELRPAWKLLEQAHSRLPAGGSFSLDLDYAELLAEMGERDQAQARFTEISTLLGSVKNHPGRSQLLLRQGRVELKEGEWQRAAASFREILTLLQERGIREGVPECFEGLAAAATAADVAETPHAGNSRARRAARLLGAAEALREAMGAPLAPIYRCDHDRTLACLRNALKEQELAVAWADGRAISVEQAVAEALALSTE
jgi:predicted ATPase